MLRVRKKLSARALRLLSGDRERDSENPGSLPGRELKSLDALRQIAEPLLGRPLRQADVPLFLEPLLPEPIDPETCDFVYSRDARLDYHFLKWDRPDGTGRNEVLRLQDFVPHLVGGELGFYSFPIRKTDQWIIAMIERTNSCDHVGRPIYRCIGDILRQRDLGNRWVSFALNRSVFPVLQGTPLETECHESDGATAIDRLAGQAHFQGRPEPWGFGLPPIQLDRSRLGIRYRFG